MSSINETDLEVLEALSGGEKIKTLLKSRGMTLKDFARKYNHWVSDVSRCLSADRELAEIREDLAAELGWSREQVDAVVDGTQPPAAEVA